MKHRVIFTAIAAALSLSPLPAMAVTGTDGTTQNTANGDLAIGKGSSAVQGGSSAIGIGAIADSQGKTEDNAHFASGGYSTSVGNDATTNESGSTAIGYSATATGPNSTAVGEYATAGTKNGSDTAIGQGSTSTNGGTAIGEGAQSTGQNSVALGHGSETGVQANVVSVGSGSSFETANQAPTTREIINVSKGTVSATSTDAVTGSQLYTVQNAATTAETEATAAETDAKAAEYTASTAKVMFPP
jgi:Hep_Hag./Haemagglutinin.